MKKKAGATRGSSSGHTSDPSLPAYTKNWPKGVYKPRNLPNGLDARIAAAHIFALPEEDGADTGPIYIVPQACARCSHDKQYCTRGQPCGRCEGTAYASTCKPRDEGWARLYLPGKTKPSDSPVADSPLQLQVKPSLPRKPRQSRLPAQQSISTVIAGKSSRYNEPVIRKSARIRHELPSSVSSRDLRAAERAKKLRLSTRGSASGTNGNRKRNASSATPSTVGNLGRSASYPRSTPSPPSSPEPALPSSERISHPSAIEQDEEPVELSADFPPNAPMPLPIASDGTAQTDHPFTTLSPLTSLRLTTSATTKSLAVMIEKSSRRAGPSRNLRSNTRASLATEKAQEKVLPPDSTPSPPSSPEISLASLQATSRSAATEKAGGRTSPSPNAPSNRNALLAVTKSTQASHAHQQTPTVTNGHSNGSSSTPVPLLEKTTPIVPASAATEPTSQSSPALRGKNLSRPPASSSRSLSRVTNGSPMNYHSILQLQRVPLPAEPPSANLIPVPQRLTIRLPAMRSPLVGSNDHNSAPPEMNESQEPLRPAPTSSIHPPLISYNSHDTFPSSLSQPGRPSVCPPSIRTASVSYNIGGHINAISSPEADRRDRPQAGSPPIHSPVPSSLAPDTDRGMSSSAIDGEHLPVAPSTPSMLSNDRRIPSPTAHESPRVSPPVRAPSVHPPTESLERHNMSSLAVNQQQHGSLPVHSPLDNPLPASSPNHNTPRPALGPADQPGAARSEKDHAEAPSSVDFLHPSRGVARPQSPDVRTSPSPPSFRLSTSAAWTRPSVQEGVESDSGSDSDSDSVDVFTQESSKLRPITQKESQIDYSRTPFSTVTMSGKRKRTATQWNTRARDVGGVRETRLTRSLNTSVQPSTSSLDLLSRPAYTYLPTPLRSMPLQDSEDEAGPQIEHVRDEDNGEGEDSEEEVMQFLKRARHSGSASPSTTVTASISATAPAAAPIGTPSLPPPAPSSSHAASPSFTSFVSPQTSSAVTFVSRRTLLDDSIVVQVKDTLYHLPRSRLEKHSQFFAELIEDKARKDAKDAGAVSLQPSLAGDKCPVFQVTEVSPRDFEALLKAFESIADFIEESPQYPNLLSVFCAARTLKFGQLDAIATYKLTTMWSDKLSCVTLSRIPYAAETVVISRKYNVPSLLKRAFYELLRSEGFAQMNVSDRDNENAETLSVDGSDLVGHARLGRADLLRLVVAREKLSKSWISLVGCASVEPGHSFPNINRSESEALDGSTEGRCAIAWKENAAMWAEKVIESGFLEDWILDPICGLEQLGELDWLEAGFCVKCVETRQNTWRRKREELWEELGVWLGL